MKTFAIWALVVLNAVLLGGVIYKYLPENYAQAQARGRPGDYLMIPVDFAGARSGVVVIVDSATNELSALMVDENRSVLAAQPPIRLQDVFEGRRR
ncbi:MAG: hypothetical protein KatS3mg104_0683 [Phycisphaerae bacterium]|jgi:hypothetical protein|nr:MAG: hypothetical protein KatS3mg104_0683 [Phycisphaerae bacterium]